MSEWQPIDTAPEGCPLLVYAPDARDECEGAFRYGDDPRIVVAIYEGGVWVSDIVEFEAGWESTGSYTITKTLTPTHWLPLPGYPK